MSEQSPKTCAILLAAGSGSRMRGAVDDKILHELAGKPVWRHGFDAFRESGRIHSYVIVHRDDAQKATIASKLPPSDPVHFTLGGKERQHSVWAGLQKAPSDTEIVLIHDCARPLITAKAISEAISAAQEIGAACVARKTTDTIKRCSPAGEAYRLETIDRSNLWSMETPQTFRYPLIKDAYQNIIENRLPITDDLSAIESTKHPVRFIENPRPNTKITTSQDLAFAEYLLTNSPA